MTLEQLLKALENTHYEDYSWTYREYSPIKNFKKQFTTTDFKTMKIELEKLEEKIFIRSFKVSYVLQKITIEYM